jgi:hypothetical protein
VFWWFERGGKFIRGEARKVSEGGAYELVVMMPDGTEGIERFSDEPSARRARPLRCIGVHCQPSTDRDRDPHGASATARKVLRLVL